MNLEKLIEDKLKQNGHSYFSSGNNWLLSTCLNPKHMDKKPSFSINLTSGSGHCFACGYSVNIKYWTDGKIDEEQMEEIERSSVYESILTKAEPEQQIQSYLPPFGKSVETPYRGLDKYTVEEFGLYIANKGKYKDRVIFPIERGHFDARDITGASDIKYMHSFGFKPTSFLYPSNIKNFDRNYVVVVEGIIDCISLWQDGIQSVCNFGVAPNLLSNSNISKLVELGIDTLYLMFDEDKYGLLAFDKFMASDLTNYFEVRHGKCLVELDEFYASDCKDYNEFIQG